MSENNNNAGNFGTPSDASCLLQAGSSSSQLLLAGASGIGFPFVGTLPSAGSRGTLPNGTQSRLGLGVPLQLYAQQSPFESNQHYSAAPYSEYERGGSVSAAASPLHAAFGEPQAKIAFYPDGTSHTSSAAARAQSAFSHLLEARGAEASN